MFLFSRTYTVPVQFRSSAGTKLFLFPSRYEVVPDTESSVNAWLIRNTFVSDQKVTWYSVNAAQYKEEDSEFMEK